MANQQTLLGLPAELRLQIYNDTYYLNPGFPLSSFRGLFFSCKQLYNEASNELIREACKTTRALETELQPSHGDVQVSAPRRLADLTSIAVTLPASATQDMDLRPIVTDLFEQMLVSEVRTINVFLGLKTATPFCSLGVEIAHDSVTVIMTSHGKSSACLKVLLAFCASLEGICGGRWAWVRRWAWVKRRPFCQFESWRHTGMRRARVFRISYRRE
ncbi:hypothetical protein K491DRAFT_722042 [Lophiostoma macrostomum CBS 122681]|uniref:Uncharacterized protein n=1 Tax=Lophiostoma macrostomum CBS 122681 TaxID=1314788 RepID=A0A6A6SMU6_9PLEO|nr:hypothetical protein K491DRAFT_722042 [Lophiostoma macrostomum CBS 122681]